MQNEQIKSKGPRRGFLAVIAVMVILIPATIGISWYLGDRKYYIASVLIMIYSMIPFFVSFERRKPQARELVTLAVMCAIAVASRAIFIAVPHFKPMGGDRDDHRHGLRAAGGLHDRLAEHAGQRHHLRPGTVDAVADVFFRHDRLYRRYLGQSRRADGKTPAAGRDRGLSADLFAGRTAAGYQHCLYDDAVSGLDVLAIYLAGIPVNAIHGSAVALGMLLLSRPMMEKLDRLKTKYGMMQI